MYFLIYKNVFFLIKKNNQTFLFEFSLQQSNYKIINAQNYINRLIIKKCCNNQSRQLICIVRKCLKLEQH